MTKIVAAVLEKTGYPGGVATTVIGSGRTVGEKIIKDPRLALVSFTGSTEIGRRISSVVHGRFGRTILELGGNNAMIVMPDANIDIVIPSATFAAVGTAGQRCTSLRRMIVHESVYDQVVTRMKKAYGLIIRGDPLLPETLMGPVHSAAAVKEFTDGIEEIKKQGGKILVGGHALPGAGFFVEPTIVEIEPTADIVKTELFVPILYIVKFKTLEEGIWYNNMVPQGLSSCMFTRNVNSAFTFVSPVGSDCGIANINSGTSGAEIGLAFGGEKETGGGRESGSDSWKQYMRRTTCTMNFSDQIKLAQGVKFDV
jgi:aldehyde dehydrogenase family 7 protein A1